MDVGRGVGIGLGVGVGRDVGVGAATLTVTERFALPPGPVQLRVKVLVEVRLPRVSLPVSALVPLQAPEAVHAVALALLQVRVLLPPTATLRALAERVKLGPPPAAVTATLTERLATPQVRVKVLVAVRLVRTSVPVRALVPSQAPEALQVVAPVLLQVRVLLLPGVTLVGLALKVTVAVGTGVGVGVVPPGGVVPHRLATTETQVLKLEALWQSSQSKPTMLQ